MGPVHARRTLRIGLASLVLAVGAMLLAPGAAYADGVFTFSGHSPVGPDATATYWGTSVGVYADSANTFPASDAYYQVFLDGVAQTTYAQHLGHWEDDGCDTWFVVDDYTVMQVYSQYQTLTDGPHTATVRFRDSAGLSDETTWDFTVAAPPYFWGQKPYQITASQTPVISAQVYGNDGAAPTIVMRVDGEVVPATLTWPGGSISYTPSDPLADNASHTVVIEATDAAGLTGTTSWSFRVETGAVATFSGAIPAPSSVIASTYQRMYVTATSAYNLNASTAEISVDGTVRYTSRSQPTLKQVTMWADVSGLAEGVHTVRARIVDTNYIESVYTWTFSVAVPPSVWMQTPAPSATVNVPRPEIGCYATDNKPGPLHVRIVVDGAAVTDGDFAQGWVKWQPSSDYQHQSVHAVAIAVTDSDGLITTRTWSFTAAGAPPMSSGVSCVSCHDTYPAAHPVGNCLACHSYGNDYSGGHTIDGPPAPAGPCLGCHEWNHGYDYVAGWPCETCHSATWPAVPQHVPESSGHFHDTTTAGCGECHDASLITEHAKYPVDDVWHKLQCTTCHSSSDARVKAAITGKNTSCTACHDDLGHRGLHVSETTPAGCFFGGCHDASKNLMDVHANLAGPGTVHPEYATSCDLCHENPAVDTSASGTACRGSCHPASPGRVPRVKVAPPGR